MANLATERGTVARASKVMQAQENLNLAAGQKVYKGLMLSPAATTGRAVNPAAGGKNVMGVVKKSVDNTDGADDEKAVELEVGYFEFNKHATNAPTAAHIGTLGYASDNNTISHTAADGALAGRIVEIGTDYVGIEVGPPFWD
jgi:hypothetical protein